MNFFQFIYSVIYSAILLGIGGIGVVLGWYLNNRSQLKTQKNQHEFELKRLEIERTEPYKERLYDLKFEAYSHIWAECMKCWREFYHNQWLFKDGKTKLLLDALNGFSFEFSKKSITLEKSVVATIRDLLANFNSIILNHAMLCGNERNTESRKHMRKDTKKTEELLDKLVNEIRKDLQLPQIEKSLAEIFFPKEPQNEKEL